MKNIATVKKSTYFDSVTLMGVSKRLEKQEGIVKVYGPLVTANFAIPAGF